MASVATTPEAAPLPAESPSSVNAVTGPSFAAPQENVGNSLNQGDNIDGIGGFSSGDGNASRDNSMVQESELAAEPGYIESFLSRRYPMPHWRNVLTTPRLE